MPTPLSQLKSPRLARPWLAGTLTGRQPLSSQLQHAKKARVNLLEIRLDTFPFARLSPDVSVSRYETVIKACRKIRKPLLLTFRAASESGGKGVEMSDEKREALLFALLKRGDWVDVEIRRTRFARRMAKIAKGRGCPVIFSRHHFQGIGSFNSIRKDAASAAKLAPGIFKIAAAPSNEAEVSKFLFMGKNLPHPATALIPMGKKHAIWRVAAFSFGSRLVYAHLGRAAAPGQMSAVEASEWIRSAYAR